MSEIFKSYEAALERARVLRKTGIFLVEVVDLKVGEWAVYYRRPVKEEEEEI